MEPILSALSGHHQELLKQILALEARIASQPDVAGSADNYLRYVVYALVILQMVALVYFLRIKKPSAAASEKERGINAEDLTRALEMLRGSLSSSSADGARSQPPSPEPLSPVAIATEPRLTRSAAGVLSPRTTAG